MAHLTGSIRVGDPSRASATVPGWILATSLLAVAAFGVARGAPGFTPLIGILIALGCQLGPWTFREPAKGVRGGTLDWVALMMRAGLFFFGMMLGAGGPPRGSYSFLNPASMDWITHLLLGELCVRYWRYPVGHPPLRAIVVLSGLILLGGAHNDTLIFPWLAPVFIVLLVCSALTLADGGLSLREVRRLRLPLAWWGVWMVLALVPGAGAVAAVLHYRPVISQWYAENFLGQARQQTGGLSRVPMLGSTHGDRGSAERVFRVEGALDSPHFRSASFSNYDRGRWGPATDERTMRTPTPRDLRSGEQSDRLVVTPLSNTGSTLLFPIDAAGIDPGENRDLTWAPDGSGPIKVKNSTPLPYVVFGAGDRRLPGPFSRPSGGLDRDAYLRLPKNLDPAVVRLAWRVAGREQSPRKLIEAVERHLMENHSYSLTTEAAPGDPVAGFILSRQSAHCEFFASAAVILLRCLDLPARYVSGYFLHETLNDGSYVARGHDAHAWAEAWVEPAGWVTVEATPPSGRPDQLKDGIPAFERAVEWIGDRLRVIVRAMDGRPQIAVGVGIGVGGAVWMIARWIARRRRRRAVSTQGAYSGAAPELNALATRFEELLERILAPCPPESTWRDHLARLEDAEHRAVVAGLQTELDTFLRAYSRARYGAAPDAGPVAETALRELERAATGLNPVRR